MGKGFDCGAVVATHTPVMNNATGGESRVCVLKLAKPCEPPHLKQTTAGGVNHHALHFHGPPPVQETQLTPEARIIHNGALHWLTCIQVYLHPVCIQV